MVFVKTWHPNLKSLCCRRFFSIIPFFIDYLNLYGLAWFMKIDKKGGVMKKILYHHRVLLLLLIVLSSHGCLTAKQRLRHLPAYHNNIVSMLYDPTQASLVVQSSADPICIYTPLSFQEMEQGQTKTYFFPRTRMENLQDDILIEQLQDAATASGMQFAVTQVSGKNYGVQVSVSMLQNGRSGTIVKKNDRDSKVVIFFVEEKI